MDALFHRLLSLSFQAGIITLAVLVLRVLLKKAPKKWICSLWLLVALRLLLPFSLESRISLMPQPALPERITVSVTEEAPPIQAPESSPQAVIHPPQPSLSGPTLQPKPESKWDMLTILEILWTAGVLAMLVYGAWSYGRLRRNVAPAIVVQKGFYYCDYIESPFVMGSVRPRIYVPSAIGDGELPYILAHEQAHIARLDPLWKLLGFWLLTIHWFNPLLWLAFLLFCRDMESACDEKVIAKLGDRAKVPYANALLSCSLPRGRIYPLAFGEIGVKQRIKEVLSYKKPALWLSLAAVLALLITGVCLLTNQPGNSLSEVYAFPEEEPIYLMGRFIAYDMTSAEERDAAEALLQALRYDAEPLETAPDPHALGTLSLGTGGLMEPNGLFFSPDGSQVAIGTPEAVEAGYRIENPKAVLDFFAAWLQPAVNRETSGKPLWEDGAPWIWAQGVEKDRLLKVNLRTWMTEDSETGGSGFSSGRSTQGGGIYNHQNLDPLLTLLHGLKKSDFTPVETVENRDITEPTRHGSLCSTVFLYDDVDRQVIAIRQEQEDLDFFVSGFYDAALTRQAASLSFRHWGLHSPELLRYMQSLQENCPTLATFVGWDHDWDAPRELSHGDARIQMPVLTGWQVEEFPYRDDSTAWGFRVRPADEEGWLFFSHWPQGFSHEEEDRYYSEIGHYGFEKAIVSYPGSVLSPEGNLDARDAVWSYQLFQGDLGDYAIVNEGADSWIPHHREAVEDLCLLTNFQAMLPEDMPKTAEGPDLSLWQKTVTPADLESPTLHITEISPESAPNSKQGTVHLNAAWLEPFLSAVRSLEDGAINDMHCQQRQSLQKLMAPECENETVAALQLPLKGPKQMLMLVYRSQPEIRRNDLRFYVSQDYESLLADSFAKAAYSEYYLEDDTLTSAVQKLVIYSWGQEWRAPITLEHGKARLSVSTVLSWEYASVPYVDGNTPWGLRIRPKGEEGWLFVSFCPAGYLDVDVSTLLQHYGPQFAAFGGSVCVKYSDDDYDDNWERKADACWEYCLFRCSFGDYVVFNENADVWMRTHQQEVEDTLTLCEFLGDPIP